ncbi:MULTISPECIES: hypothetical protein [unclassified Rhodococcus (in: high G+C Gram-positive bacteria)]|nr:MULTISPECIES: hypothetical protein [unclassified Rhodococcus (in: high G+C Gram-positive bacteria)]
MRALPVIRATQLRRSRTDAALPFPSGLRGERGIMPASKPCRTA